MRLFGKRLYLYLTLEESLLLSIPHFLLKPKLEHEGEQFRLCRLVNL